MEKKHEFILALVITSMLVLAIQSNAVSASDPATQPTIGSATGTKLAQQAPSSTTPISADPVTPPTTIDCDFAQLNLQIDSVRVVSRVDSVNGHITALAGHKLVIVRLKVTSNAPSTFVPLMTLLDFEAVYAKANAKPKDIPYGIGFANAVKVAELMGGKSFWLFLDEKAAGTVIRLPKMSKIEVAFMLPNDVTTFVVRVPTTVKGMATTLAQ